MYYCLNISCMPDGKAGCVLIRALEPVAGFERMAEARGVKLREVENRKLHSVSIRDLRKLTSGPGKLCEALSITRPRDNDKDMVSAKSDLQVRDDGYRVKKVAVTPRIGINKSSELPLRYVIEENHFVSGKSKKRS
jgi:DNA-3-methyladenine glycosylase